MKSFIFAIAVLAVVSAHASAKEDLPDKTKCALKCAAEAVGVWGGELCKMSFIDHYDDTYICAKYENRCQNSMHWLVCEYCVKVCI